MHLQKRATADLYSPRWLTWQDDWLGLDIDPEILFGIEAHIVSDCGLVLPVQCALVDLVSTGMDVVFVVLDFY